MFRSAQTRLAMRATPLCFYPTKGTVTNWLGSKGFGFVEDDADKKQHFVHHSAIKQEGGFKQLEKGQEVEFDIAQQDGRTRAENVTAPGGGPLPAAKRPEGQEGGRGGGRGRGRGRRDDDDGGF